MVGDDAISLALLVLLRKRFARWKHRGGRSGRLARTNLPLPLLLFPYLLPFQFPLLPVQLLLLLDLLLQRKILIDLLGPATLVMVGC